MPTNPYEFYGLKYNPFPAKPLEAIGSAEEVAEYATKVCTSVRQTEIDEIESKFFRLFLAQRPKATSLWVNGDLGVGKTAILAYSCNLLSSRYHDTVKSVFVQCPDAGVSGIYDHTLKYLKLEFLEDLSAALVSRVVESHPELLNAEKPASIVKKLADPRRRKNELVKLIENQILDPAEVARVGTIDLGEGRLFVEDRLVNSILLLWSDKSHYRQISEYPKGSRLNALATLFYLIHVMGYKMTVVFVDQLEYFWDKLTHRRRIALALDLREMVQRSLPYASFVATTNITTYDNMKNEHPSVFRALPWDTMKVVIVNRLPPGQSIWKLVVSYLNLAREKKSETLSPFTKGALDAIYEHKGRHIGDLLVALQGILDKAVYQKKSPTKIDEEYVRAHFGGAVPSQEVHEEGIEIREDELAR